VHYLGAGIARKLHEWEWNVFLSHNRTYRRSVPSTVIYANDSKVSKIIDAYADCAVYLAMQEHCRFRTNTVWSRAGSQFCFEIASANSCSYLFPKMFKYEFMLTNISSTDEDILVKSSHHWVDNQSDLNADDDYCMLGRYDYADRVRQELQRSAAEWSNLLFALNRITTSDPLL
jgi:hypothetical protein